MKFSCDDCGAQYMIADDKIGARGVKVRCKKCANVIILRPQRASLDPRPISANGSPATVVAPPANKRSVPPPPPLAEPPDDDEATIAVPERRPPPPPAQNLDLGASLGVSSDLGLSQEFAAHGFDGTSQRDPQPIALNVDLGFGKDAGSSPFSASSIGGSLRDLEQPAQPKISMPSALSAPAGIALPTDDDLEPRTNVDHMDHLAAHGDKPAIGEVPTRVAKTVIPAEARRPDDDESGEHFRTDSGLGRSFNQEPTAQDQPLTEEHRPNLDDLRFQGDIPLAGRVDLSAFPKNERDLSRTDGRDHLAGAEAALDQVERSLGERLDKLHLGSEASEDTTIDRSESDLDPPAALPRDDSSTNDLGGARNGLNGHEHAPLPIAARAPSEPAVIKRPAATGIATGAALATSGELDEEIGSAFESIFGAGAGLTGEADPFDRLMQDSQPIPRNGSRPEVDDKKPTKVFDTDAMKKLQDEQDLAAQYEPQVEDQAKEWYVAINDEQVGPLSFDEVKARWQSKEVDFNSLCWKQGMADWIAIRFVPELQNLNAEVAPAVSKPDEERPLTKPRERVVTSIGRAPTGTDLKPPLADRSPSTVVAAPPVAPIEAAPVAPAMAHEESEPSWRPSAASALASLAKAELDSAPSEAAAPLARSSIMPDDKFAGEKISASMFGAFEHTATKGSAPLPKAPELASSVSLREPGAIRTTPPWMWPAIVGGVVVLLGVIVVLLLRPTSAPVTAPQPPQIAQAPQVPPVPPAQAGMPPAADPAAAAAAAAPSAAPSAAAPSAAAPAAAGAAAAPAEATPPAPAEAASPAPAAKAPVVAEKKPKKARDPSPAREAKPKVVEPPPEATPPPKPKDKIEADDLLAEAESGRKRAAPVAEAEDLPEKLDDADILRVLRKYKGEINTCRDKQAKEDPNLEGVMTVKFVILKTGKTSQHTVSPDKFKSSTVGKCVLSSVKGWSFPRFAGQSMPLDFPVMVRGRG